LEDGGTYFEQSSIHLHRLSEPLMKFIGFDILNAVFAALILLK
jgi:hypothetical protein